MIQISPGASSGLSTSRRTKPAAPSTRCGRSRKAAFTSASIPLAMTKRLMATNSGLACASGSGRALRASVMTASCLQRKPERRPLAHLSLGADVPAVALHCAGDRGEADAGAGEVARVVQALEGLEQLVGEAHVEAGAVVSHDEFRAAVLRRLTFEDDVRRGEHRLRK